MIRVRVSECKNVNLVKKDKCIGEFAHKISKDQKMEKQEADLA